MFQLNSAKLCRCLEYAVSSTLLLTCAYNLVEAPHIICSFSDCSNLRKIYLYTIFPRSIAIGCMVSVAANMYNKVYASGVYEEHARAYREHFPAGSGKERFRRRLVLLFEAVCAVVVVPVNVYRVLLLADDYNDVVLTSFYVLMYVQNLVMAVGEAQFFDQCVGLHQRFQTINEEMSALRSDVIVANGYPSILRSDRGGRNCDDDDDDCGGGRGTASGRDRPAVMPAADVCALVDAVERLKCRHKETSNAVRELNGLYGLQLTMSLLVLFLMALTDIYVFLSLPPTKTRQLVFYNVWFFQYAFRFCTIVMTTDATTKEANKSKTIITDINQRSIDNSINEELQLFLNELSSRSVDFTTYDLFIINKYLIISALVTGTTFLLIYFQIQQEKM